MRRHGTILMALVLAVVCTASLAIAKDNDKQVYTLGEIVVSSEKTGVKDVAINNVIDAEEIEAIGAKTLVDALRYAPGIHVGTGKKNEPGINIHGFDQSRTLILIDGIPYYESYYGKLNLRQIPASIISRIEITKGAPSVLYGPNYLGGVINVITKKGSEKATLALTGEVSDANTYRAAATHANTLGNVNYWLSYERSSTDGYWLSNDYDESEGVIESYKRGKLDSSTPAMLENGGLRDWTDMERETLWGRIGVTPDEDTDLYLSAFYTRSEYGVPVNDKQAFKKYDFTDMAEIDDYKDWGVDLTARHAFSDWLTVRGQMFYHEHDDEYSSYDEPEHDTLLSTSRYEDYIVGGALFTDITPCDWDKLSFALHYRGDSHHDRKAEDEDYDKYFSYTGSFAVENTVNYGNWPTLVVGASYDWTEVDSAEDSDGIDLDKPDNKSEFNPMIGLSYRFDDGTRVYGSAARKSRFPSLSDYFSSKGNLEVETETSVNYVLGAERQLTDWMDVELSGFWHEVEDYMAYANNNELTNIGKVRMMGFELGTTLRPTDDLTLFASYTYNKARNRTDGRATDYIEQTPEHLLSLGADYMIPKVLVDVNLRARYMKNAYSDLPDQSDPTVDEVKMKDYFVVDGRISKEFLEHYEMYFEMKNIFDVNYYDDANAYPAPGRNFLLGVKASF